MNEEYLHKTAIDLAQEPGFIEWVNAQNTSESQIWDSWINDHPEMKSQIEKAKALVDAISFDNGIDLDQKEEKIWLIINKKISAEENIKTAKTIPLRRYISVAAIAASIILPLFIFLGDSNKTIKAIEGERLSYNFPDQSETRLNAESSIEYNPKIWDSKREVVLKGEAFFEVEKGNPFEVITNNGSVSVLGTSFNVFSRGKRFEVGCLTGRVEVKTKEHSLVLNPGEAVFLNYATNRLESINKLADLKVDWLQGEYHFENSTLKEVFEEMERQFNVEITVDRNSINESFTGSFVSANIDTALYQVCWPMNLESNKLNNKIVIKRSGTE